MGIINNHAWIIHKNGQLSIETNEPDGAFNTFINGICLEDYEKEEIDG